MVNRNGCAVAGCWCDSMMGFRATVVLVSPSAQLPLALVVRSGAVRDSPAFSHRFVPIVLRSFATPRSFLPSSNCTGPRQSIE
jgi:hypothetical protein